jgi:predicted nucleotidyltransferase
MVLPLREVLRLRTPQETITVRGEADGVAAGDWVAHDVTKFARLLMRRNGWALEQLFSPLVVCGEGWLADLRTIARGFLVRHLFHHYRGSYWTQWKLLHRPDATLRQLLDAFRIGLTGIHLLRVGEVECRLEPLINEAGVGVQVHELVERKRQAEEGARLFPDDLERFRLLLEGLERELGEAYEQSTLPELPSTLAALDDFVVRARLELGGGVAG